jgi:uncharacterized protein DUF2442
MGMASAVEPRASRRYRLIRWSKEPMTSHPIHRVHSFKIESPFTLRVRFEDDSEQVINFQPILAGELYRSLRDLRLFNEMRIDPDVHTLVWPNGADFDPATLHDWPKYVDAMIVRAKEWELSTAR